MIYIMGGKGFVGSAFVRLFKEMKLQYEIIEPDNYEKFAGTSCDIFINANGNSKKFLANDNPKYEFDSTVRTVCNSLHDFKYNKYVLCSTCDVYNNFEDPELNREDVEIDINKQSRYGFHKYIAENFVKYEAPDYIIVRFGGFVGPNLKKNPIYDILKGGPLWLHPESQLQFLHTDEAAKIVCKLIDDNITNDIFNVCGNGLVKLNDIISMQDKKIEIKDNASKVIYNINTEKINEIIPVFSSEQIVRNFVENQFKNK